jgi:phosphate transport system substrate-binding protein
MKKLAMLLALTVWTGAIHADDNNIMIEGSTTLGPVTKAFAQYYMSAHPEVNITVSESGSGNGVKSMINGSCDVASISRPLTAEEYRAAAQRGILPVAHVIALDGVSILVHPSNPVQELTVEQARKIYLGEITNWKQVGGNDKEIIVINRDTNSGTFETFEMMVMEGRKIRSDSENVNSNGAALQRVQNTPAAIGYVGLGFVDRTVRAVRVDGIYPTLKTVTSGEYPVARPLYLYTNMYPELGSHLYRLMTLHMTRDGQAIIDEIGYIPLTEYP